MLTAERLRECVTYDPETGDFFWRVTRGRAVAGRKIERSLKDGYASIKIDCACFQAHRCAWLYVHGTWPTGEIDHRNGVRNDNRLANLRDVSKEVNQQNIRSPRADNQSGIRGVFPHRDGGWVAQIMVNKKQKYLGIYRTPEQAREAYESAKRTLHPECCRPK